MSQLSKETIERIKSDSFQAYGRVWHYGLDDNYSLRAGYIAGATAEALRAQKLVEDLDRAIGNGSSSDWQKAVQEFKEKYGVK